MSLTGKEERVDDEFSESSESFGVAGYGVFSSPLLLVGVVAGGTRGAAMAFHLCEKSREGNPRKKQREIL